MLLYEVLIVEFDTVDTLSASSVASCEITSLDHELLDHTMETGALVGERFAGLSNTLLTSAKSSKVFCSFGSNIIVQFECDSSLSFFPNGNVEEDSTAGFGSFSRHFVVGYMFVYERREYRMELE